MKHRLSMRSGDMLELYQLVNLYNSLYPEDMDLAIGQLPEKISERYAAQNRCKDISVQTNPRGAGRKPVYSDSQNQQIRLMRQEGKHYRYIAEKIGCSIGHVQDVLKA